jgi:hypothetical protein
VWVRERETHTKVLTWFSESPVRNGEFRFDQDATGIVFHITEAKHCAPKVTFRFPIVSADRKKGGSMCHIYMGNEDTQYTHAHTFCLQKGMRSTQVSNSRTLVLSLEEITQTK